MEIALLFSFLLASIVLTLMPGPDILYVLTESSINGAKTGISIALGLVTGVLIHTALAATGLSILIYQSDLAFQIVKYFGAAYLFYLAYQAVFEKQQKLTTNNGIEKQFSFISNYRKGFLMNVLNPKVSVFFIAFLPKFVSPDGWSPILQMMLLGLIFIIQAIVIFTLVSVLAGNLSKYLQNEKFWEISKWIKVFVLVAIAISLLIV